MYSFNSEGLTPDQALYFHWVVEREKCRVGREGNLPKPWTTDKALQMYRFCNVRREDDTVSKWITENWMKPNDGHENMVFAMCVARLFNRVTTLELIRFPHHVDSFWFEDTRKMLKGARDMGNKIWTGAYLVSTNGHSMDKIDYILDKVLGPIYNFYWAERYNGTLKQFHTILTNFDGMGSFMAGQVIADLKFTSYLRDAPDWNTWAPIGPGSRRGLNRYFGRKLESNIKEKDVLEQLSVLQLELHRRLGMDLALHNVQNTMCEYDKYLRIVKGEGKPRSSYNGLCETAL